MFIFEGVMFIRSIPTTLLQIFHKIILNFQFITYPFNMFIKSIKDSDVTFNDKFY